MAQLLKSTYDQLTGITEEWWWEENPIKDGKGLLTCRRLQDVEGVLDLNKLQRAETRGQKFEDGLYHLARIPFVVIEQMLRNHGFNWFQSTDAEKKAMLRKPEYKYLLTRECKI